MTRKKDLPDIFCVVMSFSVLSACYLTNAEASRAAAMVASA
jgi:hypothetical protein